MQQQQVVQQHVRPGGVGLDHRAIAEPVNHDAGQSIGLGESRGRLLRVRYLLEGGQLIRLSTPILDRTAASPPWRRRVLLDGVEGLQIRAMDSTGAWLESWPQQSVAPQSSAAQELAVLERLRSRPRAIELRLLTREFGEIRRVLEVTG